MTKLCRCAYVKTTIVCRNKRLERAKRETLHDNRLSANLCFPINLGAFSVKSANFCGIFNGPVPLVIKKQILYGF